MEESKRNEFLGMAVHDLRTPLHKISLATELLLSGRLEKEKEKEFLHLIQRSSKSMMSLIDDLLDITRIESGQLRIKKQDVLVRPFLEELCQDVQLVSEEKDIPVELKLDPAVDKIKADPQRLAQVINNLLSNALKYSEPHSKVILSAKLEQEGVRFAVQDKGQGISEEEQKELFQAFHRLSAQPTAGEHSTGLGLAIVKKLVDLHQGKVWVESEQGKGSTFFFWIPIHPQLP